MQDMALMQWLVAAHKLKPPVRQVVWLGIKVDLNENTVSMLPKKFKDPARLGRPIAPTGTYMKALHQVIGQKSII